MVVKKIALFVFLVFLSEHVVAHTGKHGNDECTISMAGYELSLSGYQFKGRNPDRHYCRHFPHLGKTVIKFDTIATGLTGLGLEIKLLQRRSWFALVLNPDQAFRVIKEKPSQFFSKQQVSIEEEIKSRDLYALKLILHRPDGPVIERKFIFFVGFPFAQILVTIAVILLCYLVVIVLRSGQAKGTE